MDRNWKKRLILSIGLTLIIVAVFLGGIIFLRSDIRSRAEIINSLRQELNFRTNSLKSLATLKQDLEKTRPYIDLIETALSNKDALVNFPKDLSKLSKESNVELGFAFGNEIAATQNEPGATIFNLTLSGNYGNIINFLKSLEKSRYFISLETIDLAKTPQTQKFSALISGKVFSQ